jgi:hypothetical protein
LSQNNNADTVQAGAQEDTGYNTDKEPDGAEHGVTELPGGMSLSVSDTTASISSSCTLAVSQQCVFSCKRTLVVQHYISALCAARASVVTQSSNVSASIVTQSSNVTAYPAVTRLHQAPADASLTQCHYCYYYCYCYCNATLVAQEWLRVRNFNCFTLRRVVADAPAEEHDEEVLL